MVETETVTRPGRCTHHPGAAPVASCDLCGRPLCLSCVIPVRGTRVGRECLSRVVPDPPPPAAPPVVSTRGDALAVAGFGAVVALSTLPWSRFGDVSGPLEAWTLHWSLLAVAAAALGLVGTLRLRRSSLGPRLQAALYLGLALVVAAGSLLHFTRPPPLSSPSPAPLVALLGALAAAGGGLAKLRSARDPGGAGLTLPRPPAENAVNH